MSESQYSESSFTSSPVNYDSEYVSSLEEPSFYPPFSSDSFDDFLETLSNPMSRDDQDLVDLEGNRITPRFSSQTHLLRHETHSWIVDADITRDDVLCGRVPGINRHPGNVKFRDLIRQYHFLYSSGKPLEKTNIVKEIITKVWDQGGRFLRRQELPHVEGGIFWYDIGYKAAREKVCQALRDRGSLALELSTCRVLADSVGNEQVQMTIRPTKDIVLNVVVQDEDVLFGREKVTKGHLGNHHFRAIILHDQEKYLSATKFEKTLITEKIVSDVHQKGGRFLIEKRGGWVEISKKKAQSKTGQALREK
jgi:hypothetical protein